MSKNQLTGIYSGGYKVRLHSTQEGIVEANEDNKNPQNKDMVENSHYGVKGMDDKVDFKQDSPSQNKKHKHRQRKKKRLDIPLLKKLQQFELIDAKTLYTEMPDTPEPTKYPHNTLDKKQINPENTALLNVATNNQLYYHGYQQLSKKEIKDELDTLYTIDNEALAGIGSSKAGGLIRSGYLKSYVINKVRKSKRQNRAWYEDDPLEHPQNEKDDTIFVSKQRIMPSQFEKLENY